MIGSSGTYAQIPAIPTSVDFCTFSLSSIYGFRSKVKFNGVCVVVNVCVAVVVDGRWLAEVVLEETLVPVTVVRVAVFDGVEFVYDVDVTVKDPVVLVADALESVLVVRVSDMVEADDADVDMDERVTDVDVCVPVTDV